MKRLDVPFCSRVVVGVSLEVIERYGRHEETRTPDLYRVKVAL
jgi:hypothetical protein